MSFADNMSVYVRANTAATSSISTTASAAPPPATPRRCRRSATTRAASNTSRDLLYADISAYHGSSAACRSSPPMAAGTPIGGPRSTARTPRASISSARSRRSRTCELQLVANYLDGQYAHTTPASSYTDINDRRQRRSSSTASSCSASRSCASCVHAELQDSRSAGATSLPFVTYTHVGDRIPRTSPACSSLARTTPGTSA